MKKDELKNIIPDITGEQIDQLMKLHGADIERHKQQIATLTAERDAAAEKYHEAAAKLGELDTEYKARAEAAERTAAEKLDEMQRKFDFQNAAHAAMAEIKFTSNAARKAFLAELRGRNFPIQAGKIIGFDEFYKEAREADPAAFDLGGYPSVRDGGDPRNPVTVPGDNAEAFGKFVEDSLAAQAAADSGGWVRLT